MDDIQPKGKIELPTLEGIGSGFENGLIEQSTLLNDIEVRLRKIKSVNEPADKRPEPDIPSPIDFHMYAYRSLEKLYSNNQQLHRIVNHLSQII